MVRATALRSTVAAVLTLPLLLSACGGRPAERLTVEIVAQHPHDPEAFTQGLLFYEGVLYESTGLQGHSSLREVDPDTGTVVRRRDLAPQLFAEGLARVDQRLYQLTWRAGSALVWDRPTFNPVERFAYEGEGWGLCYDGEVLYMSDGSANLTRRDPVDFAILDTIEVRDSGEPVEQLNELECVGDSVYANVWLTDDIVRIDKASGRVTARIDAGPLRATMPGLLDPDAVLNGIAHGPEDDRFWLTGKLWPSMFEVRFVPRSP